MTTTANIPVTYMVSGQGSKEFTFNEAMAILTTMAQARVLDIAQATEPGSPADGDAYIASADWGDGNAADDVAIWFDDRNVWMFITPKAGWIIWDDDTEEWYTYDGATWELASFGGGATATIISPDSSTAHTAKLIENGGVVLFNSASTCTLTLPQQSTTVLEAGYHILARNIGGGNLKFAFQGSDTFDGVKLSQNPLQIVTILLQVAAAPNNWTQIGNDWIPTTVEDASLTAPPTTPAIGTVYIPNATATGSWTGEEDNFAIHTGSDVYEFITPSVGAMVYDKDATLWIGWNGTAWVNV